jgi:hypothetical protein
MLAGEYLDRIDDVETCRYGAKAEALRKRFDAVFFDVELGPMS